MRTIQGMLLVGLLVMGMVPVSYADISYTAKGKVVQTGTYTGPGVGLEDLLWFVEGALGGGVVYGLPLAIGHGLALQSHPSYEAGFGLPIAMGVLSWGAQRTEKYRPEDVKARIRANIAKRELSPAPGSIGEFLSP